MDSLAIPEPDKLPNEEWIIEMATAIAAMIMDKRIKTILVQIGALYRADRMHHQRQTQKQSPRKSFNSRLTDGTMRQGIL
jgi:hypothetical protein